MPLLITICARHGSKEIPGKNIKPVEGIPLIGYSIKTAKKLQEILPNVEVELSTDSKQIKLVASQLGIETDYFRPAQLATDEAGKLIAIEHLLHYAEDKYDKQFELIIDLDVTSPLRTKEDITQSIQLLKATPSALNIFSVSPPHRNPYFNVVEEKLDGFVKLAKEMTTPVLSRQASPKVYDMNASFYIFKRAFFEEKRLSVITDRSLIYIVPHICFDIDTPLDFKILEFMIREKELDFAL